MSTSISETSLGIVPEIHKVVTIKEIYEILAEQERSIANLKQSIVLILNHTKPTEYKGDHGVLTVLEIEQAIEKSGNPSLIVLLKQRKDIQALHKIIQDISVVTLTYQDLCDIERVFELELTKKDCLFTLPIINTLYNK